MSAMTDPNGMSCRDFDDVAAELALGVLTGRERAEAVAHLDECDSCREHVRQLSLTGEQMLGLLPSREPPAGFESRVMGQLGLVAPARRPKLSRRMLTIAAAALAVVAVGAGGWELRGATSASPPATATAPLRSAALRTAAHQNAGKVWLYNGNPRWLYMGVDAGETHGNETVRCQLKEGDGTVITIGTFKLDDGYGAWGSPYPVNAGNVTGAQLTTL